MRRPQQNINMPLGQALNQQSLRLAQSLYSKPAFVPQFKEGGEVKGALKYAKGGPIEGPGTGKSDSIDAELPVQSFILPVEVVQKFGLDFLQKMNDSVPSTGDKPTVAAKVSDGEFEIKPEVVRKFGAEFFDNMVSSATGQAAQPEMSEHGEMMAANGGLADEQQAARQFWQQAPGQPVPIPGRGNPANPADMMKDRLSTSGRLSQMQAEKVRGALPPAKSITMPPLSYTQAPTPQPPSLKENLKSMGGIDGLVNGYAAELINSPGNVEQLNGAIGGLKDRAGISRNAVPFNFAKGGLVDEQKKIDEEARRMNAKTMTPSTRPGTNNFISGASADFLNGAPMYQTPDLRGPQDLPNAGLKKMAASYPNVNVIPTQYQDQAANLRNKPGAVQGLKQGAGALYNRVVDDASLGGEALANAFKPQQRPSLKEVANIPQSVAGQGALPRYESYPSDSGVTTALTKEGYQQAFGNEPRMTPERIAGIDAADKRRLQPTGAQDNGLKQYQAYLQAQMDAQRQAEDYARTQDEVAFRNYGTTFPQDKAPDFRAAFIPEEQQTLQRAAEIGGQSDALKLAQQYAIEQAKLQQNRYNARVNENGELATYAESGPAADQDFQQQQQVSQAQKLHDFYQQNPTAEIAPEHLNLIKSWLPYLTITKPQ